MVKSLLGRSWVQTPTNACGYMVCKYMDQNDSAVMFATKRSARAIPEVNMRNPLHTDKKACK